MISPVIPAKAGIQEKRALLDPGFRRGDGFDGFLRDRQTSSFEIPCSTFDIYSVNWRRIISQGSLSIED
jgi:hypothetical protein